MPVLIDASADLTYIDMLSVQTITGATNTGTANVTGFYGKLAVVVTSGGLTGTTPTLTGYFQTTNVATLTNPVNVNVTSLSLVTTNIATIANTTVLNTVSTLNVISSFTVATNNVSQVFGYDTRIGGNYLWLITSVTGLNANVPMAVGVYGQKRLEPS